MRRRPSAAECARQSVRGARGRSGRKNFSCRNAHGKAVLRCPWMSPHEYRPKRTLRFEDDFNQKDLNQKDIAGSIGLA